MTPDKVEEIVKEFWVKVNEVAHDTHWGNNEDGPVHEFGYKTQRTIKDEMTELFTVTDFGNIEKWLRNKLTTHEQAVLSSLHVRLVEAFEGKAKLTENPIEENGELVDGSYYQIYKGDFLTIINSIFKE